MASPSCAVMVASPIATRRRLPVFPLARCPALPGLAAPAPRSRHVVLRTRPLARRLPDESLDLAVHPRRVRRDGEVTDGLAREDRLEGHGVRVAEVVVAHELAEAHAQAGEVPQRALEEPAGVLGALARQRLAVVTAAAVVDQDVLVDVPDAAVADGLAAPVGEVTTARADPRQALGVDVPEVPRRAALVALEAWPRWFEVAPPREAEAAQDRVHGRARLADDPADRARADLAAAPDALDAPLEPSRGAPRHPPRSRAPRLECGISLLREASQQHVRALTRDPLSGSGPGNRPALVEDARDQETTTVRVELRPRVRHQRALLVPFRVQSPEASTEGSLLVNNLYGQLT